MKHSFDIPRDVCIYCRAPRWRIEEMASTECPNNKPFRDWIFARATVEAKIPVIMSPPQNA